MENQEGQAQQPAPPPRPPANIPCNQCPKLSRSFNQKRSHWDGAHRLTHPECLQVVVAVVPVAALGLPDSPSVEQAKQGRTREERGGFALIL
ncbi:unnamed protein product, partial [Linum tenue]